MCVPSGEIFTISNCECRARSANGTGSASEAKAQPHRASAISARKSLIVVPHWSRRPTALRDARTACRSESTGQVLEHSVQPVAPVGKQHAEGFAQQRGVEHRISRALRARGVFAAL